MDVIVDWLAGKYTHAHIQLWSMQPQTQSILTQCAQSWTSKTLRFPIDWFRFSYSCEWSGSNRRRAVHQICRVNPRHECSPGAVKLINKGNNVELNACSGSHQTHLWIVAETCLVVEHIEVRVAMICRVQVHSLSRRCHNLSITQGLQSLIAAMEMEKGRHGSVAEWVRLRVSVKIK